MFLLVHARYFNMISSSEAASPRLGSCQQGFLRIVFTIYSIISKGIGQII
jgi:hypothetical protein